jgi:hypothetical protein
MPINCRTPAVGRDRDHYFRTLLGDLAAIAAGMAALVKRPERIRGYATGSGSGCHAVAETNIEVVSGPVKLLHSWPTFATRLLSSEAVAQAIACPSPVAAGMERPPLGFPRSFTPRRPGADESRRGGVRSSSTDLELHAQCHISRTSNR